MAENRVYEVVIIIDPQASEDDATQLTNNLRQTIETQGGTITKSEDMGRRRLAYEINHRTEGHYWLFEIEGTGHEIAEMERRMRVNDMVVRYLTVRVDLDRRRAAKIQEKRTRRSPRRQSSGAGGAGNNSAAAASGAENIIEAEAA